MFARHSLRFLADLGLILRGYNIVVTIFALLEHALLLQDVSAAGWGIIWGRFGLAISQKYGAVTHSSRKAMETMST